MEVNATFLLQLVLILLLLAWLSNFLFNPFLRLYDEREKRIEGAAEEAKALRAGADEKADLVESRMKTAQDEARQILRELREQGAAKEASIIDEARTSTQLRLDGARTELRSATQTARTQLQEDAKAMADEIVQKVLNRAA